MAKKKKKRVSYYEPRPLMHMTVGYAKDNKDPTEEHINEALLETLRMPVCQYVHNRVWLPHRDGPEVVQKLWKFVCDYTSAAVLEPNSPSCVAPSSGAITNCGHIAVFMMVPESDETLKAAKRMGYIKYPKEYFEGGLFSGEDSIDDHYDITWWARSFATTHYPAATTYARELHNRGYDVGFFGCSISSPKTFNEMFGEHLPDGPVHPVMMVFAGTKASAMRNSGTRAGINIDTVSDKAYVGIPWQKIQKDNDSSGLCRWNEDRTAVVKMTDEEKQKLNYVQYSNKFMRARKSGDHLP